MNSLICPNILRLASEKSSDVVNGSTSTRHSVFTPISELFRSDGNLFLVFLSGNGVYFFEKSNDPWYRGTRASRDDTYQTEVAASPLGCVQQFQFCDGDSKCGPLASLVDAAGDAAPLFNTTKQAILAADLGVKNEDLFGERASQYYWFYLVLSLALTTLPMQIDLLGASSLASMDSNLQGFLVKIPDTQWQVDVISWWATLLASVQAGFVEVASGTTERELQEYLIRPYNSHIWDMCRNQVF